MRDSASLPALPNYLDHASARRIVLGVLLTMLLAALDQVVVATALPTIAASLGDVENMSWVVTANLLSATAVTPLYGKLSDIHGRRTMLLIGIGIYAAGSIACAASGTEPEEAKLAAEPQAHSGESHEAPFCGTLSQTRLVRHGNLLRIDAQR